MNHVALFCTLCSSLIKLLLNRCLQMLMLIHEGLVTFISCCLSIVCVCVFIVSFCSAPSLCVVTPLVSVSLTTSFLSPAHQSHVEFLFFFACSWLCDYVWLCFTAVTFSFASQMHHAPCISFVSIVFACVAFSCLTRVLITSSDRCQLCLSSSSLYALCYAFFCCFHVSGSHRYSRLPGHTSKGARLCD